MLLIVQPKREHLTVEVLKLDGGHGVANPPTRYRGPIQHIAIAAARTKQIDLVQQNGRFPTALIGGQAQPVDGRLPASATPN